MTRMAIVVWAAGLAAAFAPVDAFGVDRVADVGVVGERQVEAVPSVVDVKGLLGVLEVERDGFGAPVRGSTVGGPSGEQAAYVVGGDLLVVDPPRRRPGHGRGRPRWPAR